MNAREMASQRRFAATRCLCRAAVWLGLVLAACGDEQTPPQLARFDQPNRVDFVCVLNGEPIQRDHCQNDVAGDGVALHALVTQSARGEVAAVNLETRQVLDSRRDIPGFTFTPVGEMPVALIVPPGHPELTYVADYGSRDIRVLSTSALVSAREGNPTLRVLRLALDEVGALVVLAADESASGREDLRVIAPTDMVLAPDENALIVAARDVGHVIWLPIQRCRGGEPDCAEGLIDETAIAAVPLQGSIDRAAAPGAPAIDAPAYQRLCDFVPESAPELEPPPLLDPAEMTTPRPTALAIDGDCPDEGPCTPRVLVADEALPLIHALDLDVLAAGGDPEAAVLPPLITGAPTLGVVVTPWVPATVDDGGETQFVYAIDASDGSVMVLENGRVLSVNASSIGRPDRIAFQTQAGATALEILTPAFDEREGAEQWLDADDCTEEGFPTQDPARLRGVFLAAAHTDGNVRIVDVHDMELRACRECPVADVPLPVLIRHQARLEQNFVPTDDEETALSGAPISEPQFAAGGVGFGVRANGTTGNPDVPGLDCIACSAGLLRAFPPDSFEQDEPEPTPQDDAGVDDVEVAEVCTGSTPALVCGDPDPWTGSSEQWNVSYEGPIPGTIGGRGRFIPQGSADSITGALELTAEIDFCGAGVQGEDDVAPWYEDQSCDDDTDEFLAAECRCRAPEDGMTLAQRCETIDRDAPRCIHGDQLVLTGVTVTDEVIDSLDGPAREKCVALRAALEQDDAVPIGFEIRRAFADRVVLRSALSHPVHRSADSVRTFADVAPCLDPGLLSFEVRTLNQFAVGGTQSGFQHRVRTNAAGRCVVDEQADPLLQGRARFGCTYRGRSVEFRIHRPETESGELYPAPGTALVAGVGSPATKLRVDVASSSFGTVNVVAVQLRYNEVDNLLYLVDVHRRGLVRIQLNPVRPFANDSFN